MKKFDVIVIGTGAGLMIAEAALKKGLKCAIIENSKFGGTCLTKGCIPTKILAYPADIIKQINHAKDIGLSYELKEVDWNLISKRVWSWIDKSSDIEKNLENVKNLTVYKGTCEFTGYKKMKVHLRNGSYTGELTADMIIIAAGARSFIPEIKGLAESEYVSYESFFGEKFPEKPYKSISIIGGGAIGAEFSHILSSFGTKVNITEFQSRIVPNEEEEISLTLLEQFKKNGIDVYTNYSVTEVRKEKDVKKVFMVNKDTNEEKVIESEEILVAAGLKSNTDILKTHMTSLNIDKKGYIVTNEYLETSEEGIWALGDINGKFQFRHKANYEAEILINNIFGSGKTKEKADYTKVPWAIYTWPQIAHAGMTEKQAKSLGTGLLVGKKYYSTVAKGFAMGYEKDNDGFIKVILDENNRIIGVHIIGHNADLLIQSFVYLMNAGYSCKDIIHEQCKHIHKYDEVFKSEGSVVPVYKSMVIHPSLSEVAAWVFGEMEFKK